MSEKNLTTKNTDVGRICPPSVSYKEGLYELLQDPEFEKEYLAACLQDTEYPEVYEMAKRDVNEAKKKKKEKKHIDEEKLII